MKKTLLRLVCGICAALFLFACTNADPETPSARRVVLMYSAAFNNLSSYISEDIDELCSGELPGVGSSDILLVYAHTTAHTGAYQMPTNPVLFRAYKDKDGVNRRDTITVYPNTDVSASAATLCKVMEDICKLFPAKGYGMIFSSHAKGWLPPGYSERGSSILSTASAEDTPQEVFPLTKELGIENVEGAGIDITDLPAALPVKLDFLIIDACLMGCVEVAYELRDKCDLLLFSPTEILSDGMVYTTMAPLLTNTASPALLTICRQYMEQYQAKSGYYQSATVTLVDCRKLEALAGVCQNIIAAHPGGIDAADRSAVQKYFYNDFHWFYDLRDVMANIGATQTELAALDKALSECVLYKNATEKFFNLELKRVCGLSMYLPIPSSTDLNKYYKTLAWNKVTGLIQ